MSGETKSKQLDAGQWQWVDTFWWSGPVTVVSINSFRTPYRWRLIGASFPWFWEGKTTTGSLTLWLGWAGLFCNLAVMPESSTSILYNRHMAEGTTFTGEVVVAGESVIVVGP